jgi:dihydrodipicolinate synthase/N-acetylneuraminate lyase
MEFRGALAALMTPRDALGAADWPALEALCRFTLERGVSGLVVGGGTGEDASLSKADRIRQVEVAVAASAAARNLPVLCGCGSARLDESVELAQRALAAGAAAILLPPPHFFRYSQEDLEGFYVEAAKRIDGPILLYNLPAFVTPLQPATIVRLLRATGKFVGVKDSSGDLHAAEAITDRPELGAARIVGHDGILVDALRRRLADAAISGLACVVPEAIVAAFNASETGDEGRLEGLGALLDELVERSAAMPYPWVVSRIAAARGVGCASYPFPPTQSRQYALEALDEWLPTWLDRLSTINLSRRL